MFSKPPISDSIKGASGKFGYISIAVTGKNIIKDIRKGEIFSSFLDGASAAGGYFVGVGLEAVGSAIVVTFGVPTIIVGAGVFIAGVLIGVGIDYCVESIKNKHYGR